MIEGRLIPVDADRYPANPKIADLISQARTEHPELARVVGKLDRQAYRKYYREAPIGNLLADMLREHANADVGLVAAGAIRADLEAGEITIEEVLNVFPFTDTVSILTIDGKALRLVLEKGLSLEYGLAQFSGIVAHYDGSKPPRERLASASVGGKALDPKSTYRLVTGSFTATDGENYVMFDGVPHEKSDLLVSDVFIKAFAKQETTTVPELGRLIDDSMERSMPNPLKP